MGPSRHAAATESRHIDLTDQMQPVSNEQRRARLGLRHSLAQPARDLDAAVYGVIGLLASDPATIYLSARARVVDFTSPDLERALYDERSLVRSWGMRRTLFVTTPALAAVMRSASPDVFGRAERIRLERMPTDQGKAADARAWIDDVAAKVLAALAVRGEATANELRESIPKLGESIPELGESVTFGEGKTWDGTVGMSTGVLSLLASEGRIVRRRPLGTWISSHYRWSLTEAWLGSPLADLDPVEARTELARRWLSRFGPGTTSDIKWWTVRDTRAAFDGIDAVAVKLADGPGWLLPDDLDPVETPEDWVALFPSLDSTVMGWKERDWYLGDHHSALFDRNDNAGPTVWWNGLIVGGWTQRADGENAIRLLRDMPASATGAIATEIERLREWHGPIRITPRSPSPLGLELSS